MRASEVCRSVCWCRCPAAHSAVLVFSRSPASSFCACVHPLCSGAAGFPLLVVEMSELLSSFHS